MSLVASELRARLVEVLARAQTDGEPRRVALRVALPASSAADELPLRLFGSGRGPMRFYWEQPACGRVVVGLGTAARIETRGVQRFDALSRDVDALFASLDVVAAADDAPAGAGPLLTGGFAFAPELAPPTEGAADERPGARDWAGFASTSFVLPELLLVREGERAWLTAAASLPAAGAVPNGCAAEPGSLADAIVGDALADLLIGRIERVARELRGTAPFEAAPRVPSPASEYCARPDRPHLAFLDTVDRARARIACGDLEKVVIARSLRVDSDAPYDPVAVLAALRAVHPACTIFGVARGSRVFLGASPERLVALDGVQVRTSALAGSAPRGRSPEEDARFARSLRESKKEQEEHAVVVREIEAALEPFCDDIERPESPSVLGLEGIQHLETPFRARLRAGGARPNLIDLAARLHPTPAVCGTPREAAGQWIAHNEDLERGWYAGAVGVLDAGGGGELAVALRSGVLDGSCARLFAGAGLVADSDPRAELAETRLKLRALLSQLTEI